MMNESFHLGNEHANENENENQQFINWINMHKQLKIELIEMADVICSGFSSFCFFINLQITNFEMR